MFNWHMMALVTHLTHRVKAGPFKWGLWCKANVSKSRVTSCGGVISASHINVCELHSCLVSTVCVYAPMLSNTTTTSWSMSACPPLCQRVARCLHSCPDGTVCTYCVWAGPTVAPTFTTPGTAPCTPQLEKHSNHELVTLMRSQALAACGLPCGLEYSPRVAPLNAWA
jgi:hypothetical protein